MGLLQYIYLTNPLLTGILVIFHLLLSCSAVLDTLIYITILCDTRITEGEKFLQEFLGQMLPALAHIFVCPVTLFFKHHLVTISQMVSGVFHIHCH